MCKGLQNFTKIFQGLYEQKCLKTTHVSQKEKKKDFKQRVVSCMNAVGDKMRIQLDWQQALTTLIGASTVQCKFSTVKELETQLEQVEVRMGGEEIETANKDNCQ